MPLSAPSPAVAAAVDLATIDLDRGGHLLVKKALAGVARGACLEVRGRSPHLRSHLRAWCRAHGHELLPAPDCNLIVRGDDDARWSGATRAGAASPAEVGAVLDAPPRSWGLAARGALVEAGTGEFHFHLDRKDEVWADDVGELYRQALASQWDPERAIPWNAPLDHPAEVEDALVQILTYLIENETAALVVPARFASQVHPHFREVMQLLAVQAADEARHVEVFTRRALLCRSELGTSSAGGQASLQTLVEEADFEMASFLLSVLGEGTFVNLLTFLRRHAPDDCSAEIFRLTSQDEARHVAFAMAHLMRHVKKTPRLRERFANAVELRHDALRDTAGLNQEVFDSLVLLAAGGWSPQQIERGYDAVVDLTREMDSGRRRRLQKLGFDPSAAAELSALHTRNFM
jgi:hypothetical protein